MNWLLSRRLRTRLAFKQTLSFALLAIVLAWSAYALLARRIYSQLDDELQDRAVAVRSMLQIRDGQVRWLNKEADSEVKEQFERSIRYYQLLDDQGNALETSRELPLAQLPFNSIAQGALASGRNRFETLTLPSGVRLRIVNVTVVGTRQQHYLMRVGISMAAADADTAQLGILIMVLLPLIFLVHGINAWLMAGEALQPLARITEAAKQVTPFDVNARLPVFGNGDELDQLSTTLNGTIARMQSSFQRMSEFLRNLSHEIRQPLTIMRAEAEEALRVSQSDENYRETMSNQLEHVELLARTVSDLLELAQADNEEIQLHCQAEDLSELVQAAVDGMRLKPNDNNVQISGTVQRNVTGQFDAGQLWRLILNLLDNAIKFNRPNGRVDVTLKAHNDTAIFSVTDTGLGIPPQDQARIFERGYRSQSAKNSGIPGTGLGLYFARAIAQAHGGAIEVASVYGEGTSVRVSLPLAVGTALATQIAKDPQDSAVH